MNTANKDITTIARTNFHGQSRLFGIKRDDRRRHMHIIGKTGMGKTSLLLNMAVSDIRNGEGLAFVDPHGDVADALLDYIPEERVKDVVYFNPQDLDFPIAFNVLGDVPKNQRHIIADGLVGVFKKIWADSWGPRLEYILRNAILSLLENQDSTLLDIMRILVDKDFRANVVHKMEDQILRQFWLNEFAGYSDKLLVEAISPIQNKVGQFTSSPLIRNIIGQKKSSFNLREIMDQKKILIMNLSKGAIGEGGAQLLGAMMITKMQLAAMSRVDIPQEERQDFFAYIDEFQNFSTDSFAEILSEARKYRLSLILAHQYIEQLSEVVRGAVFGNVGTTIVFRIGAADAEFMEREFTPTLTIEDLVNLPKWRIYLKLMIDGVTSQPFSADTLPDPQPELVSMRDKIIAHSRAVYGVPNFSIGSKQTTRSDSAQSDSLATESKNISSAKPKTAKPGSGLDNLSLELSVSQEIVLSTDSGTNDRRPIESGAGLIDSAQGDIPAAVEPENLESAELLVKTSPPLEAGSSDTNLNPILAKKLKEIFSRSASVYDNKVEYLLKAKFLKSLDTEVREDKLGFLDFMQELLQDIKTYLMTPKPTTKSNFKSSKKVIPRK